MEREKDVKFYSCTWYANIRFNLVIAYIFIASEKIQKSVVAFAEQP